MDRRIVVETPCEHGYVAEHYEVFFGAAHGKPSSKCPGGSRRIIDLVPSPEAIEAAAPITRELISDLEVTSLLPVEFEGSSHDATVWTIAIVNAFIRAQFGIPDGGWDE